MMSREEHTRCLELLKNPRGGYQDTSWKAQGDRLVVKTDGDEYVVYQKEPFKQFIEFDEFEKVELMLENYAGGFYSVSCVNCGCDVENRGKAFGFDLVVEFFCSNCSLFFEQPVRTEKVKEEPEWF